jgi:GNAT superfamily N-acetyltransferase
MMNYITTKDNTFYDQIVKSLRAHNFRYTGVVEAKQKHIYVIKDGKLVAGSMLHLSWNWLSLRKLYYTDIDSLSALVNESVNVFKGKFCGFKFYTQDQERVTDFEKVGFKKIAQIEGTKSYKDTYHLEFDAIVASKEKYELIVTDEPLSDYDDFIIQEEYRYKRYKGFDYKTETINIAAFENDVFAGGVVAITTLDTMYIDLLVVEEAFRMYKVGSTLMNKIEAIAKDKEIKLISLGTTEFQARGFYEKLGYEVVYTQENNPIGYQCFSLVKKLGGK